MTAPDAAAGASLPVLAHDAARPLAVAVLGVERRAGARILDLTLDDGADGRIAAFLVAPAGAPPGTGAGPGAGAPPGPGILWAHWFDSEAANANRTQFLDEAVRLAGRGVTSLLPQGAFPWASGPTGSATDRAKVEAEVLRIRRGLDLLIAGLAETGAAGVAAVAPSDPARLAMVGHDFGGMAAAVALAADRRPCAAVLIAVTPRWADWFLPFWPIAEDRLSYLAGLRPVDPIEWIGQAAPAALLLQFARHDFYIAPMTAHELHRAASQPKAIHWYDAGHDMDVPKAQADRLAFLAAQLRLG